MSLKLSSTILKHVSGLKKSKIPWRDKKFSVAEIAGENHNSDNAN